MKHLTQILSLLCGLTLSGCVYEVDPGHPSRPHHGGGGGHHAEGRYYQDGYNRGEADARRGLSKNPSRNWSNVPRAYRNEYTRGYNRGYENRRPGHGSEVGNYYQSGSTAAVRDKARGLSNQPSRHWNSIPRHARDEFSRGYAAGWRQSPGRPSGNRPGGRIPPNMRR